MIRSLRRFLKQRQLELFVLSLLILTVWIGSVQGWVYSFEQDQGMPPPAFYSTFSKWPPIFFAVNVILFLPFSVVESFILWPFLLLESDAALLMGESFCDVVLAVYCWCVSALIARAIRFISRIMRKTSATD